MRDAIELMASLRGMASLDERIRAFSRFLAAEFHYDGFTYGVGIDTSSLPALFSSFLLKEHGMHAEWMAQYAAENLGQKDLTVMHTVRRAGVLQQSRIFKATDAGDLPEHFAEVPRRVRDFSRSGFFLSLHAHGLIGGMGLHSSTLTPEDHDAHFARHGAIVVELCRMFHDMASWRQDILAATGLSQDNLTVLQLRGAGLRAKEIIERTGHAHENSVTQHLRQVQAKLGTRNDRESLLKAASLGLIASPDLVSDTLDGFEPRARSEAERMGWMDSLF